MRENAKVFLEKMELLLSSNSANGTQSDIIGRGPWIFGFEHPTALDAHLAVFIQRMRDVGRNDLIPNGLDKYANWVTSTAAWKNLMQDRKTMRGV